MPALPKISPPETTMSGGSDLQRRLTDSWLPRLFSADVRSWMSESARTQAARGFVEEFLGRVTDEEFAVAFHAACPIDGASPSDYNHRVLEVAGEAFVAGIRFLGLDPSKPFVDVVGTGSIAPALGVIAESFRAFAPLAVRQWWSEPPSEDFGGRELLCDQYWLAGSLAELRAASRPAHHERVRLAPASADYYERYVAAYEDFHRVRPDLAPVVSINSRQDMQAAHGDGLVFDVHVDGELAGVFSAQRAKWHGLPVFEVLDEVLIREFRGRGFAAAAQRHMLDALPGDGLIVGSISARNEPSLRTALGVGRVHVGAKWFVSLQPAGPIDRLA